MEVKDGSKEVMHEVQKADDESYLRDYERQLALSSKDNQEDWIDHCRELVIEYKKLAKNSKTCYEKKQGDIGYILSLNWLDHWKKYAYFNVMGNNNIPDFEESRPTQIKDIDNADLLIPKYQFVNEIDPKSHYNFVIKEDLRENVDYIVVDKDIWNFFHSRYGGEPLKRVYHKIYTFIADVETKFTRVNFVILPPRENCGSVDISQFYTIYSSMYDTLEELLVRIVTNMNSDQYGYKLQREKIKAWKFRISHSLLENTHRIREFVCSQDQYCFAIDSQSQQEQRTKSIIYETAIADPAECLEAVTYYPLSDFDFLSSTLIIEVLPEVSDYFTSNHEVTNTNTLIP
ncbi:unnamed protein product [Moneuplotes crassus]|uniref:DUSP domain-containing protein n=1 Tax=Euplotes crassus TaxID=5936 RepID=A0AAD1XJ16_EUPCR|nr:unnamed protein product [Moneuplotes crassus]